MGFEFVLHLLAIVLLFRIAIGTAMRPGSCDYDWDVREYLNQTINLDEPGSSSPFIPR